jgi:acyl-CoA thioester hydrolase
LSGPFRHRLRVRYNECDPQAVVFNANYLTYFDLTMTELWRGFGGYQAMVESGVDLVVAEARVRYLDALRFDDEFEIEAAVTRLGETSMTTEMTLLRNGKPVAVGELRHVFVESGGGATAPIPAPIRSALGEYSPAAS